MTYISRYAIAKSSLNDFSDARKFFLIVQKLKPNTPGVAKYLTEVSVNERKYKAQEKLIYKRMFENLDDNKGASAVHATESENQGLKLGRRTTIDEGIIIAELDDDETSDLKSKKDIDKMFDRLNVGDNKFRHINGTNATDVSAGGSEPIHSFVSQLKPVFIDTVLNKLDSLKSGKMPSVLFPCNLSTAEIAFLDSTAADYNFQVEFVHKGNVKYPKVVKLGN